jgi:ubiquinone/menaquinone biosynthesis C-methylase UbiE
MSGLSPAAAAFDSIAEGFDARYGEWLSVAAQRRAVRAILAKRFPTGSNLLEVGGGTGEDAQWLLERGRSVLLTDASPAMVRIAAGKLAAVPGAETAVAAAEHLAALADLRDRTGARRLDGAYSNFAALNCVEDLDLFAWGLARLLRPGAEALLVVFGTACPGEVMVEALRGRPKGMFRRIQRGAATARLGGRSFTVRYHRGRDLARALSPWFKPAGSTGICVFVPPSAAEPWISRHPRLLAALEGLDRHLARPLAPLGDHVLYRFVRTEAL